MFTGIVEKPGSVVRVSRRGGGARLEVQAPWIAAGLTIGDSVAVNGACVTVTEKNHEMFACDLVPETVARTNLGILEVDELVNLERPVRATDRLGGHIVQGHVDAVGVIRSRRKVGSQEMLEVTIPFELARYLAPQGSVALDGVSLTVVSVDRDRFKVALIPHTVDATTLGRKVQGSPVNVEVDVISKYVERHMAFRASRPALLFEDAPPSKEAPRKAPELKPARAVSVPAKPKPASKPAPAKKKSVAASAKKSTRAVPAPAAARKAPVTKSTPKHR